MSDFSKNLGLVKTIFVALSPPLNIYVLWYDNNIGIKKLKYFDQVSATWIPLAGTGVGAGVWGGITGTLSDQTDLQSVLDTKQDLGVYVAGATIGAQRLLMISGGGVVHFDPTDINNYGKEVGFSLSSGLAGDPIIVSRYGVMDGFAGLVVDDTYFADVNGLITSTPLTSGISLIVGVGATTTKLSINLHSQIIL